MATENGTFSYQPTTSGTYTWSFRMKNSGTLAQPASVYYLDNLQVSYPYPYTRIDCDKGQNASYRFGFNGKENDMETGTQDYGFRIYNPQLGKFLSVDPLTKKYPELTPYQFASNTPIQAIDLDGLEAFDVNYISGTKNTSVISSVSINNNAPFNNGCVNYIESRGVSGSETERFCTSVSTITPFAGTNMITFPTISRGTATSAGNFITSSINNVLAQRIASSPIGSTTTTNVQKTGTINVHGQIFRTSFTVNETAVLTGINPQVDVQLSARNINSPTFQSIQSAVCSQNYNTTITTTNTSVIGRVPGIIDPQNRGGIGVQAQIDLNKSYTDSNGNSTKSYDVPCVESVTHPASGQTITNPSSCP